MNIEHEIRRSIINFTKQHNIPLSDEQLVAFMADSYKCRRISLIQDTFLSVCEFLIPSEIVIFTTTCKEFMSYYPFIWGIIQSQYFPKSIIPNLDYISIRQNMAIDCWWYKINKGDITEYYTWDEIVDDDVYIQKRFSELKKLVPSHIGYIWKKNTNLGEIKAMKETRLVSFDKSREIIYTLINDFKFISKKDDTNEPYLTIKPKLDMRIYGFTPGNKDDKKKWEEGMKWITGKYTEEKDYDYDLDEERDYETYEYGFDYGYEYDMYRIRMRPDWL